MPRSQVNWTGEATVGTPYWWPDTVETRDSPALPKSCDILVIGGGYTGLSAALTSADSGAEVVVLEAGKLGCGASTRNGGMVGAHPRFSWDILRQRYNETIADTIFAEASSALTWAHRLIQSEKIDCDYQTTGRLQLAWTKDHFENQKRLVDQIKTKSTVQAEVVERADLKDHVSTKQYFGGILFPEHGALHPAKYHAGLVEAVRKRNIPLLEDTPALSWKRRERAFLVETSKGTIRAEKIILATNGYTPAPFRWHQRRVFPLPSYLIATEKLPKTLIAQLAPSKRMMVETRARHSYFRVSPDGTRIIWGGRAAMAPTDLNNAAARLKDSMIEVWPDLVDVKLSHVWTGNTGYSFNHMPHVGNTDGLHYAMGYSGSGTVLAPYLGSKAAYQALGDDRGETAYSATQLRPSFLHPFEKPYFLQAADFWYRNWVDRRETKLGRNT